MLAGQPCGRGWQYLWNIVDVRDVGEAHALIVESGNCGNGTRYQLTASDRAGELNVQELQTHLARLFPHINVGGPPKGYAEVVAKFGGPFDAPRAYCDRARTELGLKTHPVDNTLLETGGTLIELGLVKPALLMEGGFENPLEESPVRKGRFSTGFPCASRNIPELLLVVPRGR